MATETTEARSAIDRFFKISERGSTVSREIRGGLVTFFAMAYIIVLNPLIIGTVPDSTGPSSAAATRRTWPASPRPPRWSPGSSPS
jgi:adenine/guanine/hypoxanthine permease